MGFNHTLCKNCGSFFFQFVRIIKFVDFWSNKK